MLFYSFNYLKLFYIGSCSTLILEKFPNDVQLLLTIDISLHELEWAFSLGVATCSLDAKAIIIHEYFGFPIFIKLDDGIKFMVQPMPKITSCSIVYMKFQIILDEVCCLIEVALEKFYQCYAKQICVRPNLALKNVT